MTDKTDTRPSGHSEPRVSVTEAPEPDSFENRDIPALLVPLSNSAILSLDLRRNKERTTRILTPSLAKFNLPGKTKPGRVQGWQHISTESLALKLQPSAGISHYSFGSGPGNYSILRSTDKDECYVNHLHCQIIPDPDRTSVILYNASTSVFRSQNLDERQSVTSILPTSEKTFHCGNWYLELGKGLDFLLKVLPRSPKGYAGSLICSGDKPLRPRRVKIAIKPEQQQTSKDGRSPKRAEQKAPPLGHQSCISQQPDQEPTKEKPETIGLTNLTQVFKVEQNGKVVAAKVCRKPNVKQAADTWLNEMRILFSLSHNSIVQMLDFDGSNLTIFLEYIEGVDLSKLVDGRLFSEISESDQQRIWKDISSAIEYIHGLDIVHHDIKPENIIFGKGDRGAVLCDFGLATSESGYQNGGTPCYIAPEFIYGERAKPNDIWAFGVTMLFVSCQLPLPSGTWRIAEIERDFQVLAQMIDWLDQVRVVRTRLPKHLAPLRNMLSEDADERTTASDLVKSLNELIRKKTNEKLLLKVS